MINLYLHRDIIEPEFTLGELTVDGAHFGYTCEDTDRQLEHGGGKVPGQTCIPRGQYRVQLSFSPHFGRITPEILQVPGYTGVRIHGGNTNADTLGCPLLGKVRTVNGVSGCAERNKALIDLIERAEDFGDEVWMTIS